MNASFHNANFSQRIRTNEAVMKTELDKLLKQGLIQGKGTRELARSLRTLCGVSQRNAERLMITELARVQIEAQKLSYEENDFDEYEYIAEPTACPICKAMDGKHFKVAKMLPGENAAPMHPHCRCSTAPYSDRKEFDEWLNRLGESPKTTKSEELTNRRKERLAARTSKDAELTNRRKERLAARKAQKQNSIPDLSKMERSEIVRWAEKNLSTKIEGIKGANKEFVRETVKVLAEFEKRMGGTIDGLSVKFGGLSSNVYAKYDDATKTLLLKKTGSLKAFEDRQKAENVRYRFKWKKDKDYYSTDTYSGTIWHELGHAIDIETGQRLSGKLGGKLYEDAVKVSAYSGIQQGVRVTKASEAWAENFAAYMEKNTNASKVPNEIKEMIENYFKQSLENKGKSGRMEMYRKGSTHRKTSLDGHKIIDKATYHKITKPAIKKGADIRIADKEWTRHLEEQNATAVTIGDIIIFREDATVSDVLEETYHFMQNKIGLHAECPERERVLLNEIDAKKYVLSMSEKYHVPAEEIALTKKQLESYQREMDELIKRGEWRA